MRMNETIEGMLFEKGVDLVRFIDITGLPISQTQGYARAILFFMAMPKDFIIAMHAGEDRRQEYRDKEYETDALADWIAEFLAGQGFRSCSQSEKSIVECGTYDKERQTSRLPHKTIARLAGIGFIGKNDMLISEEYGCALSMCTILTDAPVATREYPLVPSECGSCDACIQACTDGALLGKLWSEEIGREGVIDVSKCTCTLKCMVNCPYTLRYALGGK